MYSSISPQNNQSHHYQLGFSLIEVLVAALILFLSITIAFTIYRGSIQSAFSAEQSLNLSAHVMDVQVLVSQEVKNAQQISQINGAGAYGVIDFTWSATPLVQGRAEHPDNPPISQTIPGFTQGATVITLWEVNMELSLNGKSRAFTFTEMSW